MNIEDVHTTGYYSTIKRNGVLSHTTVSLNLEKIRASERIQTERPYIVWFHFCEMSTIGKFLETEISGGQNWEEWAMGVTNGYGVSFPTD